VKNEGMIFIKERKGREKGRDDEIHHRAKVEERRVCVGVGVCVCVYVVCIQKSCVSVPLGGGISHSGEERFEVGWAKRQ
jgi:streptolysin S family bacteriocin protoxin